MLLFDWTVHKAITYNEQLKMKRDAQLEAVFLRYGFRSFRIKEKWDFYYDFKSNKLIDFSS